MAITLKILHIRIIIQETQWYGICAGKEPFRMSFYEAMEQYYDAIFPLDQKTLDFLEQNIGGAEHKHILDLACGTGNYTIALAERGFQVTGIDLDETMIELAQQKKNKELTAPLNSSSVSFLEGNMLELSSFLSSLYDGAFCIGNSLVHLETVGDIEAAVKETAAVLHSGASLIVQTVNYDRILKHGIKSLPTLENKKEGVSFERLYSYDVQKHRVHFTGKLTLPDSTSRTNTIPLYPLQKAELEEILVKGGFTVRQLYGNFAGKPWSAETPATVVIAGKNI